MVNQKVIVFQESFLRSIKNTDYYVVTPDYEFLVQIQTSQQHQQERQVATAGQRFSSFISCQFFQSLFPFLQYQPAFPISKCQLQNKGNGKRIASPLGSLSQTNVAGYKLQDSMQFNLHFDCPKLYSEKRAGLQTGNNYNYNHPKPPITCVRVSTSATK